MLPINSIADAQRKWKEDEESKLNEMKYLGRRIRIEDKRLMFHPSFLPQLICHLLSGIVVGDDEPYIWNEGLILKHSKEYFIGLFMHGMMESNLQENRSNQSKSRKHGEPNRLKMMDILIKGPNIKECQILMNTCLESIEYINHFYGNLKWNQEVLFPSTIQKYYSIVDKRNLFSIPLNESIGNDQIQSIIKEEILQDKLLTLYNSERNIFSIPLSENNNENNGDNQFQDLIQGDLVDSLFTLYNSGDKNQNINKHLIHMAFHEGHFEIIKKIIEQEKQNQDKNNTNEINEEIMFGIYLSCQNEHSNILGYVIGSGIQIDFRKTFWNKNCLEIASEEQNTDIVNIICQFQQDPLELKTEYRKKYGFPSNFFLNFIFFFAPIIQFQLIYILFMK